MRRIPHPDTEAAKGHDRATTRGATLAPSLSLVSRASSRSHNILARQPIESRTLRLCLVASAGASSGAVRVPRCKKTARASRIQPNPAAEQTPCPHTPHLRHTVHIYYSRRGSRTWRHTHAQHTSSLFEQTPFIYGLLHARRNRHTCRDRAEQDRRCRFLGDRWRLVED